MKTSVVKVKSKVQELLFVISPGANIERDISVLKDDVQYLTGKKFDDRFAKAHITLFNYVGDNPDEILDYIEERAANTSPFNIFLKDFNVFYGGSKRSIYLDIINKYAVSDLFDLFEKDEATTPHLSIARNLSAEDFLKCWPYFKAMHYSQHFCCDTITVLCKEGKRWVHYKDILLGF
jgi:2'-5' RNA ligase